jgi:putative flippase GtrA
VARLVAVIFNYSAVRRAVFLSEQPHRELLPSYLCVAAASVAISYVGIRLLLHLSHVNVLTAKVIAETVLFIANFILQRDFVFTKRLPTKLAATDWDRYYKSVPWTARLTRKYTQSVLLSAIRRFTATGDLGTIVELGGANSCFIEAILADLNPRYYHVIDSNDYGLALLRERMGSRKDVLVHSGNVLRLPDLNAQASVVFSIGLVEHFDRAGTREAIRSHFALLQSGGCAIISFPTPTWLYVITRLVAQLLGIWQFPDERPLRRDEVLDNVGEWGEIVFEKILWPLVLTQHLMVIRKF